VRGTDNGLRTNLEVLERRVAVLDDIIDMIGGVDQDVNGVGLFDVRFFFRVGASSERAGEKQDEDGGENSPPAQAGSMNFGDFQTARSSVSAWVQLSYAMAATLEDFIACNMLPCS
jgi:hypothetical protein